MVLKIYLGFKENVKLQKLLNMFFIVQKSRHESLREETDSQNKLLLNNKKGKYLSLHPKMTTLRRKRSAGILQIPDERSSRTSLDLLQKESNAKPYSSCPATLFTCSGSARTTVKQPLLYKN